MVVPAARPSVITVLNLKGGVGKTHACWLLASVAQERQERILIVDTDTQGNITSSFLPGFEGNHGVEALFDPSADPLVEPLIRRTAHSHIDIIPSSRALTRFDLADQAAWEKSELQASLIEPLNQLRPLYDLIVFDCPPRLSLVSFAALCASDAVIVPLEAADWGAQGIKHVAQAAQYVQLHFNSRLRLLGYLVSRFKRPRSFQQAYLRQLRTHFGTLAFDTVIPDLAAFEKAVTDRVPITLHDPRSNAAVIARDFYDEVQRRLQDAPAVRTESRGPGLLRRAVASVLG